MQTTYLDKLGLERVSEKVNSKLAKVKVMPTPSADLLGNQALYVGPYIEPYAPGVIYTCVAQHSEYTWHADPYILFGLYRDGMFYVNDKDNGVISPISYIPQSATCVDAINFAIYTYDTDTQKWIKSTKISLSADLSSPSSISDPWSIASIAYRYGNTVMQHIGPTTSDFVNGYFYGVEMIQVEPVGSENPITMSWFIYSNGKYVLSEDTSVDPNETYYEATWKQLNVQPSVDLDNYLPTWTGTSDEWEALTDDEKSKYVVLHITDDEDTDTTSVSDFVWGSNKPIIASALASPLRQTLFANVFFENSTSTYNLECQLGGTMSLGIRPNSYALLQILPNILTTNYTKSEVYAFDENTGSGTKLATKTVPTEIEGAVINVFIQNKRSDTIQMGYIIYGNASGFGTDKGICLGYTINMSQDDLSQVADTYKALDQAGLAIYMEVT